MNLQIIPRMVGPDLDHRREMSLARLRYIVAAVREHGYSPTHLAKAAGLGPPTVNRKLSGTDRSLIKPQTLSKLEEAAARLIGKSLGSSESLMAELDATNHNIAQSINDLVRILVERGVLQESDLPPHLREALKRRRMLLELLGLPVS